jgi:hypothetical protein
MLLVLVSLLCVSPTLLRKSSKRPAAGQRRPNLKILAQELMPTGRMRVDVLDRVMPKPLPRLPSYDPEAGDSPTGSATFVICVDGDENVSLFVNRQAYTNSNGVRRVACAFSSVLVLTRSWMLPEARRPPTCRTRMRCKHWTCPTSLYEAFVRVGGSGCFLLKSCRPRMTASEGKGRNASCRRARSDGTVLVEERYLRVEILRRDGCWRPQGAR